MKQYEKHLQKAYKYSIEAQSEYSKAVRSLMRDKGFDESYINQFSGCEAGGGEVIISYNSDCNMSDLLIQTAVDMTKDEIIDNLLRSAECEQTRDELKSMKG